MVNTGIIGSLEQATHLLEQDNLIRGIEEEFKTRKPQRIPSPLNWRLNEPWAGG
jgi:hypothetical protein